MDCVDIGEGYKMCKPKKTPAPPEVSMTFAEEIAKAITIATAPYMTKDEAAWVETNFATTIFSYVISGFSIAFGFYLYYIIGAFGLTLVPDPMWNAAVVMGILLAVIITLGFIQYRVTKALISTNMLERIAIDNGTKDLSI